MKKARSADRSRLAEPVKNWLAQVALELHVVHEQRARRTVEADADHRLPRGLGHRHVRADADPPRPGTLEVNCDLFADEFSRIVERDLQAGFVERLFAVHDVLGSVSESESQRGDFATVDADGLQRVRSLAGDVVLEAHAELAV